MARLSELTELLEAATGPSLDLDGRVWCAVNELEFVMWDGAGCVYKDPAAPSWDRGIKHAPASLVRPYTASIDAAVALVERKLPGWSWNVERFPRVRAQLAEPVVTEFGHGIGVRSSSREVSTPAIALIIALLKALPQSSAPDNPAT